MRDQSVIAGRGRTRSTVERRRLHSEAHRVRIFIWGAGFW